jgi:hypothetical protein
MHMHGPSQLARCNTKFWKQPSVVTSAGRRLESRLSDKCPVWNKGEKLAAFMLPYHSAETIAFLQQFHDVKRGRFLRTTVQHNGPDHPIDLTGKDPTAEITTELSSAQRGVAALPRTRYRQRLRPRLRPEGKSTQRTTGMTWRSLCCGTAPQKKSKQS